MAVAQSERPYSVHSLYTLARFPSQYKYDAWIDGDSYVVGSVSTSDPRCFSFSKSPRPANLDPLKDSKETPRDPGLSEAFISLSAKPPGETCRAPCLIHTWSFKVWDTAFAWERINIYRKPRRESLSTTGCSTTFDDKGAPNVFERQGALKTVECQNMTLKMSKRKFKTRG